jgi:hypothetical protein
MRKEWNDELICHNILANKMPKANIEVNLGKRIKNIEILSLSLSLCLSQD